MLYGQFYKIFPGTNADSQGKNGRISYKQQGFEFKLKDELDVMFVKCSPWGLAAIHQLPVPVENF